MVRGNHDGMRAGMVGSLLNGLTVLDMFDHDRPVVTVAEIAKQLELHRSNASRVAATLASAGYLRPTGEPGHYRLGGKLVGLGQLASRQTDLAEAAAEPLGELVAELGETGHLGVLDGNQALTVDVVDGWHTVRMHSTVGKRAPAHCSSIGKALLADLTDDEVDALYSDAVLESRTVNTVRSLPELKKQLATIRKRGYAVDDEELEIDLRCIGAPVFDARGRVAASVSVSGPSFRVKPETVPDIAEHVLKAARRASDNLGAPRAIDRWHRGNS